MTADQEEVFGSVCIFVKYILVRIYAIFRTQISMFSTFFLGALEQCILIYIIRFMLQ